jgi:hypothetical protein
MSKFRTPAGTPATFASGTTLDQQGRGTPFRKRKRVISDPRSHPDLRCDR